MYLVHSGELTNEHLEVDNLEKNLWFSIGLQKCTKFCITCYMGAHLLFLPLFFFQIGIYCTKTIIILKVHEDLYWSGEQQHERYYTKLHLPHNMKPHVLHCIRWVQGAMACVVFSVSREVVYFFPLKFYTEYFGWSFLFPFTIVRYLGEFMTARQMNQIKGTRSRWLQDV
jgi:hypothetical protein